MGLFYRFLTRAAFLFIAFQCFAFPARSDEIERSPAPEWVDIAEIPQTNPARYYQTNRGEYWLLSDFQVFWDWTKTVKYYRSVVKVLERQGLEHTASIDIDFDPSNENLVIHHIKVLRDGETIDHTNDVTFSVLRREKDLEDGIVDGELTAHANIRDFRVNDSLDLAYSRITRPDVFGTPLSTLSRMEYKVPVGLERYQVTVPETSEVSYKEHALDIEAEITTANGLRTYSWSLYDQEPIPSEEDRPRAYPQWGYVELTSWKKWTDIGRVVMRNYRPKSELPESYRDKLDAIARTFPENEDRITEVLRNVQDSIRYVGIEIGSGGFIPRQPEVVIERGYGDCKDKSLLMVAMLKHLGIEASVALVHNKRGAGLKDRLPSPYAFNHAIVHVKDGDKVYWLDPTLTHQGGRGTAIAQPDYGYALVLHPDETSLQEIQLEKPDGPLRQIEENYTLPDEAGEDLTLVVASVYHHQEADAVRRDLARNGTFKKGREYLDYYDDAYRGIKPIMALKVEDDLDANRITLREAYTLPLDRFRDKQTLKDFRIRAIAFLNVLPEPDAYGRSAPLALPYPGSFEHSIKIRMPFFKFRSLKKFKLANDAFSYLRTTKAKGHMLWLKWQMNVESPQISAEAVEKYLSDLDTVITESIVSYDFTDYLKKLDRVIKRSAKRKGKRYAVTGPVFVTPQRKPNL